MTIESLAQIASADEIANPRDIRKTGINPDFWYPVARSKAVKKGKIVPQPGVDLGSLAIQSKIVTAEELALWHRKEALRKNVIKVDDFPQDFGRAEIIEKLKAQDFVKAKAA